MHRIVAREILQTNDSLSEPVKRANCREFTVWGTETDGHGNNFGGNRPITPSQVLDIHYFAGSGAMVS